MSSKEIGGLFSNDERGCYHINDADADMEPFVLTAESAALIRTQKFGISVEKSSPIFNIAHCPQIPSFTPAATFEKMT
jgi:hypothetical protein